MGKFQEIMLTDIRRIGRRMRKMRKKYKIREGSIADYARFIGIGMIFWGALFALAVQSYPM